MDDSETQLRILLIDDNPVDVAVTLDALAHAGLDGHMRVARGGQEALDYLFGRGQFESRRRHPLPDLVLLDLNMPVVDGYAVLRQMKEQEALWRIPVVILCSSQQEGSRAIACGARAHHFLVKPLAMEDLSGLRRQYENWTLRLDLPLRPGRPTASSL
jgi:CheY-like chemotaxis protein